MKKLLLIAAFLAAPAALAEPTYTYFDLNYQFSGTMEVPTCCEFDTTGFGLKGSYALNDNWFVQFDSVSVGTDPDIGETTVWSISGGWHGDLFFARLGYENAEEPFGVSGGGYLVDLGLRSNVTDSIELNLHVGMSDNGDFGSTSSYGVGALWMYSDALGVTFNYDVRKVTDFATITGLEANYDSMGLGVRFTFE